MLDVTTGRASCHLLSTKSLELRSLILLLLEEAFSIFSAAVAAAQMTPGWCRSVVVVQVRIPKDEGIARRHAQQRRNPWLLSPQHFKLRGPLRQQQGNW